MTTQSRKAIRKPVRRSEADDDILLMLLSFAASVVVTRVFLQLTGFPKIGGDSGLHIAHVLWGGLLLFIATLLPLIFANQWVYPLTAILSGVGVGLFIDEVGKFITATNDYFYPAAAPIIYGFFLLTVLLYFQIRRRRRVDTRSELYYALSELTEAIDQDLDTVEKQRIEQRLNKIKDDATQPVQAQLAQELLDFLHSDQLIVIEHRPNLLERQLNRLKHFEARYFTRPIHRAILIAGMLLFGVLAIYEPVRVIALLHNASDPVARLVQLELIRSSYETSWFVLRMLLQAAAGGMLLVSTSLLVLKDDRRGVMLGLIGMLFYLITVNMVVLYFDQFTYILATVIEFGFFMSMLRYRRRFITPRESVPTADT
ncbi:MAG TPA: hypothetical protein VMP08_11715 [Anaerolineae bacterium]|nr:hypothetical protein [Anaerolineae bacterium]